MSPEESHKIVQFFIINWVWFLGLVGAIIGCIYSVAMHKFKYDRACCDVDTLNKSSVDSKETIVRIESSLATIIDMISGNFLIKNRRAKANSPVTYTSEGLKLLEDSHFPTFFESKKELFIDLLTKKEIGDEAGLDKACWEIMFALDDKEITESIRNAAYENGFPEPALRKLCAIYLREELKEDLLPQIS